MATRKSPNNINFISLKKFISTNRNLILSSLSVFLLGLFLRTYNLLSIPIFVDEAIYVRWSQVMRSVSSLRFLPLSDGKQPLFMWVTIPFLKLFSDPLIATRMVSVVSGMINLIGIFILVLVLFKNKKIALAAAFLYAISPFSVFFDRMAMADSMLSMFITWSMLLAILTSKTRRLDMAMLTGFALGGAWLTKSPAIFFILLLPITYLTSGLSLFNKNDRLEILKLVGLWVVSWLIAFGLYNILRLGPEFHMIALRNKDYIFSLEEILNQSLVPFINNVTKIREWYWLLLPGSVFLAAVCGFFLGAKRYWREFIILFVWAFVPVLVQAEFAKVVTSRYILFTLTPLFIFAAYFIGQLIKIKGSAYIFALVIISLPALWIDYLLLTDPNSAPLPNDERAGYVEGWTSGYGIREVAEYVKNEKRNDPNIGILVATEGYFGTLPDGLMIYLSDIPGVVVKGVGFPIYSIEDSLAIAKRSGNKAYLVVNSTRLIVGPETLGLKLINSYPKAVAPSGKQESLLLFEVTDKAMEVNALQHSR